MYYICQRTKYLSVQLPHQVGCVGQESPIPGCDEKIVSLNAMFCPPQSLLPYFTVFHPCSHNQHPTHQADLSVISDNRLLMNADKYKHNEGIQTNTKQFV